MFFGYVYTHLYWPRNERTNADDLLTYATGDRNNDTRISHAFESVYLPIWNTSFFFFDLREIGAISNDFLCF